MTKQAAIKAIRALGLNVSYMDDEYRVTYNERDAHAQGCTTEDVAYYTPYADDALDTARAMADALLKRECV